ncbi:hypothetical protein GALL_545990 [mine drainage metagenome]|uniref:Uncharacterized protein n=1 Tax=mine drainage metagenome TaxID=410659 RepID=A0A1J5NYM4_9ZZZZ
MRRSRLPCRPHIRRNILEHHAGNTCHHVRAYLAELMHPGKAAQDCVIAYMHVSGQRSIIGKDGIVSHLAIMRQMDIRHDPVIVADAGYTRVLYRPDVKRAELANNVAIAYFQSGRFTCIFFILRDFTQRTKLENLIIASNRGVPVNHCMGGNSGTIADLHVFADDAVRADADIRAQLCAGVNNCSFMYH